MSLKRVYTEGTVFMKPAFGHIIKIKVFETKSVFKQHSVLIAYNAGEFTEKVGEMSSQLRGR